MKQTSNFLKLSWIFNYFTYCYSSQIFLTTLELWRWSFHNNLLSVLKKLNAPIDDKNMEYLFSVGFQDDS